MRAALPWFRREGRNETLIPCKGTCALKQCTPSPVASTADRDIQGCSDGPGSPNSPANERNSVEFTYGDAHAAIVGKYAVTTFAVIFAVIFVLYVLSRSMGWI